MRTANGQLAVLRPGQPGAQLIQAGATVIGGSPPPGGSPPAGSAGDAVAPNVVQQSKWYIRTRLYTRCTESIPFPEP